MTITRSIEVELTPGEVAEAFCKLRSDGQALFFNEIAKIVDEGGWWLGMQLQYVTDDESLTLRGRAVMALIGDYSLPKSQPS